MLFSADVVRKGEGKVALGATVNLLPSVQEGKALDSSGWQEGSHGKTQTLVRGHLRLILPSAQAWCQALTALVSVIGKACGSPS